MAKTYRSKTYRNLKSATSSIARSTGNLASKGATQAFKWATNQTPGNAEFVRRQSNTMEIMQGVNSNLASLRSIVRRMERQNSYVKRFMDTGIEVSIYEKAIDWVVDLLLSICDYIWGFFEPILSMLWMTLIRIVLIIGINFLFFGALYLLLTA